MTGLIKRSIALLQLLHEFSVPVFELLCSRTPRIHSFGNFDQPAIFFHITWINLPD